MVFVLIGSDGFILFCMTLVFVILIFIVLVRYKYSLETRLLLKFACRVELNFSGASLIPNIFTIYVLWQYFLALQSLSARIFFCF